MKTIQLTQGWATLVDDEDYEKFSQFRWYARVCKNGKVYAVRRVGKMWVSLHRQIVNAKTRELIDHRDRNTLNNQRSNLRRATYAENMFNSNPRKGESYKGIYLVKDCRYKIHRWRVQIRQKHYSIHVGYFASEIDAARAYDEVIKKLRGDFARLNFNSPSEPPSEERGSTPTVALQNSSP